MDKITVVCHKDHDKGYEDFQGKCLLCEVERLQKREWAGLTDEEIKSICDEWKIMYGGYLDGFVKFIEVKIKEKNL